MPALQEFQTETNAEKHLKAPEGSFTGQVARALVLLEDALKWPKGNVAKRYAKALMWKIIADLATKRYEHERDLLIGEGLIDNPKDFSDPGIYQIGKSGDFEITVNVSQHFRMFSPDVLATRLQKEYKVPAPIVKKMIEEAKVPGPRQNRPVTITEQYKA